MILVLLPIKKTLLNVEKSEHFFWLKRLAKHSHEDALFLAGNLCIIIFVATRGQRLPGLGQDSNPQPSDPQPDAIGIVFI